MPVSTAAAVRARSLRRLGLALTLGLLAGLFALSARAQAPPISAEERREAVEQIGRLLDAQYVFPDVGRAAGQHLAQQLAAGAYDDLADAEALAARLTEDLQSISRDRHMRVRPAPMMRAGGDRDAAMARMRREQRAFNYGFARVERLEGNVGYLDLRGMAPIEEGRETAAAAMRLLEGVDALIVDLRQNGGGDPRMVQFLSSYLFGERTHLNSLYWREGDRTEEFWTLDEVPGQRLADVPVFVLTSQRTFSGGEEFAYNLRTRDRATLIGETTGGGANPGGMFPVSRHLGLFVPTGRAINPVTGTNWEGTGVEPHIAVPAAEAYDRALALAREAAEQRREAALAAETAARGAMRAEIQRAETLLAAGEDEEARRTVSEALRAAIGAGIADEGSINNLGYEFLQRENAPMAILIFAFNVEAYPDAFNTYDSLGEAYMVAGQRDLAIANYERSLELNPENENGRQMLARLRGQ